MNIIPRRRTGTEVAPSQKVIGPKLGYLAVAAAHGERLFYHDASVGHPPEGYRAWSVNAMEQVLEDARTITGQENGQPAVVLPVRIAQADILPDNPEHWHVQPADLAVLGLFSLEGYERILDHSRRAMSVRQARP